MSVAAHAQRSPSDLLVLLAGLLGLGALLAATACAASGPTVLRIQDGRRSEGRFISVDAYGAYAEAALRERHGDDQGAAEAFQRALQQDPESVEIYTRLGALHCRLGQSSEADSGWKRARSLDAAYPPLWREQARCLLQRGQARAALGLARYAVELDPRDEEASLVVADAQVALGDTAGARRWLEGLVAFMPRAAKARARLAVDGRPGGRSNASLVELDRFLVVGDLAKARSNATKAGLTSGELSVRALVLGRSELAKQQATLVLAADPHDTDAWVAALGVADLMSDEACFVRLLGSLDPEAPPPGPLARWLLAEIMGRRLGAGVGRHWVDGWSRAQDAVQPPRDELEAWLVTRVEALLVGGP